MKIIPTFDPNRNIDDCTLWAVCYDEDKLGNNDIDILTKLFQQWNDSVFLNNFLKQNQQDLTTQFWDYISVDEARNKILDEVEDFEDELISIELKYEGYEDKKVCEIFEIYHKIEFLIKPQIAKEKDFRKVKPDFNHPMLRLYGIELEDETIIITGGIIKLTKHIKEELKEPEIVKLRTLLNYLKAEGISTKEGLI